MSEFFLNIKRFKKAVDAGALFIDAHEYQIKAADAINAVDEEGLLHLAKEEYSWQEALINDYLEIYNEIQSGARI